MADIIKLRPPQSRFKEGTHTVLRDGTPLEKGVLLTEDALERNRESLQHYC